MSRSLRRTPIAGNTTASSEKTDKRLAHRKLRSAVRQALHGEHETMPELREVSSTYAFAKDGKRWWRGWLTWPWRGR